MLIAHIQALLPLYMSSAMRFGQFDQALSCCFYANMGK
jgi:hypothetical protein